MLPGAGVGIGVVFAKNMNNNQFKSFISASKIGSRGQLQTVNVIIFHRFISSTNSLNLADTSNVAENSNEVKQMLSDHADMQQRDIKGGYLASVKGKELVRYDPNSLNVKHAEFSRAQNEDPNSFDSDPVNPLCFSWDSDSSTVHAISGNDTILSLSPEVSFPICFANHNDNPVVVIQTQQGIRVLQKEAAEIIRGLVDPELAEHYLKLIIGAGSVVNQTVQNTTVITPQPPTAAASYKLMLFIPPILSALVFAIIVTILTELVIKNESKRSKVGKFIIYITYNILVALFGFILKRCGRLRDWVLKKNYSEVFVHQRCIIEYNKRILLLNIKKLINMVNTSVNLKYLRKDGKSNKVLLKLLEKPEFNKIIEDITSNYTKIYEEHQNFVWIAVKLQKNMRFKICKRFT